MMFQVIGMQATYHIVRVFTKAEEALGNKAAIFLNDKTSLKDEKSRISVDIYKNIGVNTTCFISHVDNSGYEVQCFNGKNNIQCCGHGMIAAAKAVFSNTDHFNVPAWRLDASPWQHALSLDSRQQC